MKRHFKLMIAAAVAIGVTQSSCNKDENSNSNARTEVEVAGLFSLTGNWSSLGNNSKAAMELAANDVNRYFEEIGSPYRIKTTVFDTKLDTALALNFLKQADSLKIKFIVGPQSSAEVASIKTYADDNELVVVSQGSTAGSLAIEKDNIFRFCPSDAIEGAAHAKSMYNAGIRGLVTVARDDAGNRGLQQAVTKSFTELGGSVISIAPYSTSMTDYAALIDEVHARVQELKFSFGTDAVGVYLSSFDECVSVFQSAWTYEILSEIQWYGSDGVALSNAIVADSSAATFAIKTHFFAPAFGLPDDARSKWQPLAARIESRTGIAPDAFALAAYDAVWVWALSIAGLPDYPASSFTKLRNNFIQQANSYYGATGPTLLNNAGDREIGSFDYWGIVQEDGSFKWKLVGKSE